MSFGVINAGFIVILSALCITRNNRQFFNMALNLIAIKKLRLSEVRNPSQTSIKVPFGDGC